MGSRGADRFQGSEADLCDWLIEREATRGWVAYPEHAGWDVLMVRERDGFQVGVQAKLRANCEVIAQAADGMARSKRPDVAAVLVPDASHAFVRVARLCGGIKVLHWSSPHRYDFNFLDERLHSATGSPGTRHELPPFVPAVRAGSPAPTPLTKWKLAALRLCLLLDRQGYVTTEDIKRLGMSPTRWLDLLRMDGYVPGRRLHRLVRGDKLLPDQQYPELAAQVAAHYQEAEVTREQPSTEVAKPQQTRRRPAIFSY